MESELVTNMLIFCCVDPDWQADGLPRFRVDDGDVWDRLKAAKNGCDGRLLIVEPASAASEVNDSNIEYATADILNVEPYRAPEPVVAAGGIITRFVENRLEVLLIYRRGVWDLPKGKLDDGESIEECAVREVREELGIDALEIVQPLGVTIHAYPDGSNYAVKTTHWFEMTTPARTFTPQRTEDIESVQWSTWEDAHEKLGFETLRQHLRLVEHRIR